MNAVRLFCPPRLIAMLCLALGLGFIAGVTWPIPIASVDANPNGLVSGALSISWPPMSPPRSPLGISNDIIVDDRDSGFSRGGPASGWHQATAGSPYNGQAWWTYTGETWSGTDANNYGVWTPSLPSAGQYEVFAFIPSINTTRPDTTRAQYEIHTANGDLVVVEQDQNNQSGWVSLGVYAFDPANAYVRLRDVTPDWFYTSNGQRYRKTIKFDAIKWTPQQSPNLACGSSDLTIQVLTPLPTQGQPVTIRVSGTAPSTCTPEYSHYDVQGDAINIYANPTGCGRMCIWSVTSWSFDVTINSLQEGAYVIHYKEIECNGSPSECSAQNVYVFPPPPDPGPPVYYRGRLGPYQQVIDGCSSYPIALCDGTSVNPAGDQSLLNAYVGQDILVETRIDVCGWGFAGQPLYGPVIRTVQPIPNPCNPPQVIHIPSTGLVQVRWISATTSCSGEFGLKNPGRLPITMSWAAPFATSNLGYYNQGDEVEFYLRPGGACAGSEYSSLDSTRAHVTTTGNTTRISWEAGTDNNFDDLVVEVVVSPPLACPGGSVDVVFAMDTSGSMNDEFDALCQRIDQVITALQGRGVNVSYRILAITDARACAAQTVAGLFPGGHVNHFEDWGPAVYDLANRFAWRSGATRLIIPMSDEGPDDGCPCEDPGPDRNAITEAIQAARSHGVVVSPVIGTNDVTECDQANYDRVWVLANDLANGTGGRAFHSADFPNIVVQALYELIGSASCQPSISGLSQDCGHVASQITIFGNNFASGATVDVCQGTNCRAAQVTTLSVNQIAFVVPNGLAAGTYDIVVTNPGGYRAIWGGRFGVDIGACAPTYSISGRVTDDTGAPLSGAAVVANSGTALSQQSTDSNGYYTAGALPPGVYTVSASKAGYSSSGNRQVTLPPSQSGVDFALARPMTDDAQFVSQSAYPTVQVGQSFQIYFEVRNTGATTWRQSDNYYLANLQNPLGANPRQEVGEDVPPGSSRRFTIGLMALTTPGTYRTQWVLKHANTSFGPNMYLDVTVTPAAPQTYSITGQVTDDAGAPVPDATVTASGATTVSALTGSDGRYVLTVPTGAYTVSARKTNYTSPAGQSVNGPPDRSGVNFVLTRPQTTCTANHWAAEFFNTRDLSGAVSGRGCYDQLDFDWGNGAPSVFSGSVNADNFSARFHRTIHFDQARYFFSAQAQHGVRVKVDGQLVLDEMNDRPIWDYQAAKDMSAGDHEVLVEYMHSTGAASLTFDWWQRKVIIIGGYGGLGYLTLGTWTWGEAYQPWKMWEDGPKALVRYLVGEAGTPESALVGQRLGLRWGDFKYFSYTGQYAAGQLCSIDDVHDPGKEPSCFRRPQHTNGDTCLGRHDAALLNLNCTATVTDFQRAMAHLDRIMDTYPDARFDLIGHSQGGVIGAFWAGNMGATEPLRRRIHSIIPLDSPVRGWCPGCSGQAGLSGYRSFKLTLPPDLLTIAARAPQRVPLLNIANTRDMAVRSESAYFPNAWTWLATDMDAADGFPANHDPSHSDVTQRRVGHTLMAGMVVWPTADAPLSLNTTPSFELGNIQIAKPTALGTPNSADYALRFGSNSVPVAGVYQFPFDGWGRVGGRPPFEGDQLSYIAFRGPNLPAGSYELRTQTPEHAFLQANLTPGKRSAGDLILGAIHLLASAGKSLTPQDGDIVFYAGVDRPAYTVGDAVSVGALLLGAGPVTGASVTARLVRPSGSATTVALRDDGGHGDDASNDGLYAYSFTDLTEAGGYQVVVSASGTYQGVSFSRQQTVQFSMAAPPRARIDLSIGLDTPSEAAPGETIGVRLRLANLSSQPATGVTVGLDLPAEVEFVSDGHGSPLFDTGSSVAWQIGDVPASATQEIQVAVRILPTAVPGTTARLETSITSDNPDPVLSNSAMAASIYIRPMRYSIFLPLLTKSDRLRGR